MKIVLNVWEVSLMFWVLVLVREGLYMVVNIINVVIVDIMIVLMIGFRRVINFFVVGWLVCIVECVIEVDFRFVLFENVVWWKFIVMIVKRLLVIFLGINVWVMIVFSVYGNLLVF